MHTPLPPDQGLRRVLTLWPLIFYGMGIIVGAGIYVALGSVMERAGSFTPISFLIAGIAAGLTGICYAELASHFPEAAGAATYVRRAFGSNLLGFVVGAATTFAVAAAGASIARGAIEYLAELIPLSAPVLTVILVILFTAIASIGVKSSVNFAALIGIVEVLGLCAVIFSGIVIAPHLNQPDILPTSADGWLTTLAGAFIAFFAFIGFESLANLAEEVKDPERTLPRGIIGAIAASAILYVGVALAVVLSNQTAENPLLALFSGKSAIAFAAVGFVSVANGVLVEIMMLSRLFYGMAKNGQLPKILAAVHPRTRTPLAATVASGAIMLGAALFIPFAHLLVAANVLTLGIFVLVDAALLVLHIREPRRQVGFLAPKWVPPIAVVVSLGLLCGELLR
jgi:APA family basic amino acid/polyamine antiporter